MTLSNGPKQTVWCVDDDESIRWVLSKALEQAGFEVRTFTQAQSLRNALQHDTPHALISDIRMPGEDGLHLLEDLQSSHPKLPVVIITAHSDLDSAVQAFQGGAFEYLPKPFDVDDVIQAIERACAQQSQSNTSTPNHLDSTTDQPNPTKNTDMIGEAPAMQEVFRAIGRLAHSSMTVLINGESGTGKERVASALHKHSPRAKAPFVALNMAAIPKDLLDAELFGHEKGAFTGATQARKGRFAQAHQGTLFLDEIGDMPLETQTRLLRVLADGIFYPIGSHIPMQTDVRIIAATHQDLENLVKQGAFREDLFHRLNVIRIRLPKLCERNEDIPALANYFLQQAANELNVEAKILTPESQQFLTTLPWPGNVRQLQNCCRWLTVMAPGREVLISDLPQELSSGPLTENQPSSWQQNLKQWAKQACFDSKPLLDQAMPEFEKIMIEVALAHTQGKKKEAAELLGWGRNTLTRKIQELEQ